MAELPSGAASATDPGGGATPGEHTLGRPGGGARTPPTEAAVRLLVTRALDGLTGPGAAPAEAAEPAVPAARAIATPVPLGSPATHQDPPGGTAGDGARTVALGADHGGYALKQVLAATLADRGYGVTDCGTTSAEAVDYPDFAHVVGRLVASGACTVGIVVDGAGIGSAMAANKVPGVRAANAHDTSMARNAREHNYANVLTLGARMIGEGLAIEIVDTFLATPWGAERHGRRVAKITAIEQQYNRPRPEDETR